MKPYYQDDAVTIFHGCALEVVPTLDPFSLCATDPPYGLRFMNRHWDYDVPCVETWRAIFDALNPGAHCLAFAGTRTQHRMAVNIEDAGFEIRDMIAWVHGQGFPKNRDIGKAIDAEAGAEREVVGISTAQPAGFVRHGRTDEQVFSGTDGNRTPANITAPATDAARQWNGWGTALKPAIEPITVARKPFKGTVAACVLEHGTGAIHIDACRVGVDPIADASQLRTMNRSQKEVANGWGMNQNGGDVPQVVSPQGRWPANLIHDGSEEVTRLFPVTTSGLMKKGQAVNSKSWFTGSQDIEADTYGDTGSAARFFYVAKPSKRERGEGNTHCTVKPVALMEYLIRLGLPPGGVVLDPFAGSGTTGVAAKRMGVRAVLIERDESSCEIAAKRLAATVVCQQLELGGTP